MATLAPASSEFVEALRRGLEAYDAGDIERANHLFDEALEIEPDNVWGLLWKGATAPTVGESKMWLEQAVAIDSHNEHARAGLKWANEQLAGATDDTQTMMVVTHSTTVVDVFEEDSLSDAELTDEGAADSYDWLTEGATASSEELEDFASLLEETANDSERTVSDPIDDVWEPVTTDDSTDVALPDEAVPDAFIDAPADEIEDTLPDWLAEEGTAEVTDSDEIQSSVDVPDWLMEDGTATTEVTESDERQTSDGLPDWLAGDDTATTEATDEADVQTSDGLPDWLMGDSTPSDTDAVTFADEPTTEPVATDSGLPDWLMGDDEAEPQGTLTAPADVADDSSDLPDWLSGTADVTTDEEQGGDEAGMEADLSQPADLPDWLADDVPTSATATELPDWLTMEDAPPPPSTGSKTDEVQPADADLPDWLLGTGSAEPTATESTDTDLPDWLLGGSTSEPAAPTAEADLPDWLTGGAPETPSTVEAEADLPDWLTGAGETTAPEAERDAVGELPSWLLGDDSTPFEASRGQGSLAPSDEVVEAYQAGLWAYEEDRLDDATRAFQRVIRLDPTHVEAHNYLGSVFYLNGRQDDAIIALRRALELDPDHSESYLNLGLVYKETGRNSQAVQMFSRYLDLAPPDDTTTDYVREMIDQLNG